MIECPYCLAQIPDRASTCQFCANPVSPLLETRAKLAQAEQKLASATAQILLLTGKEPVEPRPVQKWSPQLTVFVFYVASIYATATASEEHFTPLLLVMAALLGFVIANRDPAPNVWTIAMFAFAQPLFASVVIILRNPTDVLSNSLGEIVRSGFLVALQLAGAAIASSLLYLILARREQVVHSVRLPSVTQATAGLDRSIKFVALIATGLTTVIGLFSTVGKLLSKGGS